MSRRERGPHFTIGELTPWSIPEFTQKRVMTPLARAAWTVSAIVVVAAAAAATWWFLLGGAARFS